MSFVSSINILSRKFSVKEADRSHRTSIMSYNGNNGIRTNFMENSQIDLNQVPAEEDDENRLVDNHRARISEENMICRKGHWTHYEDEKLREVVDKNGSHNWNLIASKIEGRSGMSCRSRWFNYLDSGINKREFSEAEENKLILAQEIYGNKWTLIAKQFPGRTDNALKNRWHKLIARMYREKNSSYRQQGRRPYCYCATRGFQCLNPNLNDESMLPQIQMGAPNPSVANVGPSNDKEELPFYDFLGTGN